MSPIYKIITRDDWRAAQAAGRFEGSALDLRDGYIHLSTAEQWEETLQKHFAGQADLVLLSVDPTGLDLRWEPSRGGTLFPHLYEPLPTSAVIEMRDLPSP